MASSWVALCVNPKPITDTSQGATDRQWAALHSTGIIMVSHGLHVPSDTPGQPTRGTVNNSSWTIPRWGFAGASMPGYQPDAGIDLIMTDWTSGALAGYALDTYGGIWPFGPDTPFAATGYGGAPFGPTSPSSEPIYKNFQMHSANSQAFGLGGFPSGFGWLLSYQGTFYNNAIDSAGNFYWPSGPAPTLQDPAVDIPGLVAGIGSDVIQDFQVNPNNSGQFYVLFKSGYIYCGHAVGVPASGGVANAWPSGRIGQDSGNASDGNGWLQYNHGSPFVAMHINWGDSIIAIQANGGLFGYNLQGGSGSFPAFPAPSPWFNFAAGGWVDMSIVPYRGPSHLYLLGASGTMISDSISGTVTLSGLTTSGTQNTTTQPTLSWSYSAQYGVAQRSYSVRVYPQSYIDAQGIGFVAGQNAGSVWQSDRDTTATQDHIGFDLLNGVAYRAYLRVTSAAGTVSAWSNLAITPAIPIPGGPSPVTATPHPAATWPGFGSVTIAFGGGLGAGERFQVQQSIEGGPFNDVLGAESLGSSPFDQTIAPAGLNVGYRVRKFKRVPGLVAGPWVLANGGASIFLAQPANAPGGWALIDPNAIGGPGNPLVVPLSIKPGSYKVTRTEIRGEWTTMSSDFFKVESQVKGLRFAMTVQALTRAAFNALWGILGIERSVLFKTAFGELWWVRAGPGTYQTVLAQPLATETTGIRHYHDFDIELVQTAPELP